MSSNNWTINDSLHLYQIGRWSDGYFNIHQDGELSVLPNKEAS